MLSSKPLTWLVSYMNMNNKLRWKKRERTLWCDLRDDAPLAIHKSPSSGEEDGVNLCRRWIGRLKRGRWNVKLRGPVCVCYGWHERRSIERKSFHKALHLKYKNFVWQLCEIWTLQNTQKHMQIAPHEIESFYASSPTRIIGWQNTSIVWWWDSDKSRSSKASEQVLTFILKYRIDSMLHWNSCQQGTRVIKSWSVMLEGTK